VGNRQIELSWVCSSCSHRNLGRYQRCQQCDDPKDSSEQYEMPSDTKSAASVTDAELLRMATAGANWRCAYCGSDQRAFDGSCKQCGAGADQGKSTALPPPPTAATEVLTPWRQLFQWGWRQKLAVAIGILGVVLIAGYLWVHRERTYDATVGDVKWTHAITVERYAVWDRQGWRNEMPSAAFDIVSKGQQVHHYDQVLDGYTTEYYTVQTACGEDCTESAPTCHEVCTNNNNGFATCHDECSGGGRHCTTRYCNESRSRQVPRYRQEPRYAEAVAYKIWDWGDNRTVQATGNGTTGMRWPTEEARVGIGLSDGERERERRTATYDVTIRYDDSKKVTFGVPAGELNAFAVGTKHQLRVKDQRVIVDGRLVKQH
jgi:hypothetical protein